MLEALGPRAVAGDAHRAALGAVLRHALAVAAMVAGEVLTVAVQYERDVAVRAHPRVATRAAVQEVRPAPAVEQHDRLPRRGQRVDGVRVQRCLGAAHVDRAHGRRVLAVDAPGETQAAQGTVALGARRGAAAQQQRAGVQRALGGDAAGVVARVALVLVGRVVLLVDDDEPHVGERREHGAARPDAHPRVAGAQPVPLVAALGGGELGVQDRDGVPEPIGEAGDDLRRQRDLGDKDDRRPPACEHCRGRLEIDLGLARPRDPVQEQPLRLVVFQARFDLGERGGLLGGERWRGRRPGAHGVVGQGRAPGALREVDEALGLQTAQGGQVGTGRAGPGPREVLQQRALAIGEAVTIGGCAAHLGPEHPLGGRAAGRGDEGQPPRGGGAVLGRHPGGELHEFGRNRLAEHPLGRDELLRRHLARLGQADDDAGELLVAERDAQQGPDLRPLRGEIVERPAQRPRGRQRLHAHDHGWRR